MVGLVGTSLWRVSLSNRPSRENSYEVRISSRDDGTFADGANRDGGC